MNEPPKAQLGEGPNSSDIVCGKYRTVLPAWAEAREGQVQPVSQAESRGRRQADGVPVPPPGRCARASAIAQIAGRRRLAGPRGPPSLPAPPSLTPAPRSATLLLVMVMAFRSTYRPAGTSTATPVAA